CVRSSKRDTCLKKSTRPRPLSPAAVFIGGPYSARTGSGVSDKSACLCHLSRIFLIPSIWNFSFIEVTSSKYVYIYSDSWSSPSLLAPEIDNLHTVVRFGMLRGGPLREHGNVPREFVFP